MKFSEFDLNILAEIGNISVGGAATSLSNFVNKLVTISIPDTKIQTFKELKENFDEEIVFAKIDYSSGLEGSNILLMTKKEAFEFSQIIVKEKLDENLESWSEFSEEVLSEMFNIMVGNMTSSMSEIFNKNIRIETPRIKDGEVEVTKEYEESEVLVGIWFELRVESNFSLKLVNIMTEKQAKQMIELLREDYKL
jgi:flagellar motor switch protein FliN